MRAQLGQCLPVDFAVWCERQAFQGDKCRWHHVIRQAGTQMIAQLDGIRYTAPRRNHIPNQPLLSTRTLLSHHHAVLDCRMSAQHRFDLSQFNPETSDLHLMIDSPEALQRSIQAPARQISRPIQPRPGPLAKWIRDEFLGRQLRALQVAHGDALASNQQFTRHSNGLKLHGRTNDIDRGIVNRTTNANRPVSDLQPAHRRPNRCLRWSIHVPEGGALRSQLIHQIPGHRLASHQTLQLRITLPSRFQQHPPGERGRLKDRGCGPLQFTGEHQCIRCDLPRGNHHRGARGERKKNFQPGNVKRQRRHRQHHIVRLQTRLSTHRIEKIDERTMGHLHPFGAPRGTRGEDHIGKIVACRRAPIAALDRTGHLAINHHHRGAMLRQMRHQ